MSNEKIRIVSPHRAVGDIPNYHEWLCREKVRCDRLGRRNGRIRFAAWQKWICNNGDCPAVAFVPDSLISGLIEGAGDR